MINESLFHEIRVSDDLFQRRNLSPVSFRILFSPPRVRISRVCVRTFRCPRAIHRSLVSADNGPAWLGPLIFTYLTNPTAQALTQTRPDNLEYVNPPRDAYRRFELTRNARSTTRIVYTVDVDADEYGT